MLAAGLTVAVGTDSIVNLPAGTDRISPLDEIRFLHARDGTDPMTLLEMATVHAARALGIDDRAVRIAPESAPLGLVAVPVPPGDFSRPADAIARSDSAPRIVLE
jgi:cytosine/adenosine deaminase-related metal-dependent hydrolase